MYWLGKLEHLGTQPTRKDKEMSLRQRVNQLKKSDPDFFLLMSEWRDEFRVRRTQFDDKRWERKGRDMVTHKTVKILYRIEDACKEMWDEYRSDPEWNGEDGELAV